MFPRACSGFENEQNYFTKVILNYLVLIGFKVSFLFLLWKCEPVLAHFKEVFLYLFIED